MDQFLEFLEYLQIGHSYFYTYHVYIFLGLLLLLVIVAFVGLVCLERHATPQKFKKSKNFRNDLSTWKDILMKIKHDQKLTLPVFKLRFYLIRIFITICVCWGLYELYFLQFYSLYIYILQFIYAVLTPIEYLFYIYGVSYHMKHNYNRTSDPSTCLMIPFGGSKLEAKLPSLESVIQHAIVHFDSRSIFLLHNGSDFTPKCYTKIKSIVDKYSINYLYLPLPNKTYAIYYCSKNIAKQFSQCLIIDDDVILPYDLYVPTLPLHISAVAYPICAYLSSDQTRYQFLINSFQNIEYALSGLLKLASADWNIASSTLSHHGAIGLWKRNELITVLTDHDGVFDGEDLLMGILALNNNFKMKVINEGFIPTETPNKIFGIGGLYRQRVYSWDYVVLKYVPTYIKLLLLSGFMENIILKFFILHELWTIFIDFQRLPIFIYILYMHSIEYLYFFVAITVVNICIALWCNYIILSKRERSTLVSIFLFPVYKLLLILCRLLGEVRYLFKFTNIKFRNPILISAMPELPNILENTEFNIGNFHTIQWNKIWSNRDYLHKSMSLRVNKSLRKKEKEEEIKGKEEIKKEIKEKEEEKSEEDKEWEELMEKLYRIHNQV